MRVRGKTPIPPSMIEKLMLVLEALAVERGLRTPAIYEVVFYEGEAPKSAELVKVSEGVVVGEGLIAVKTSDLVPLVIERLALGYYSLSLMPDAGIDAVRLARRVVRDIKWNLLSLLSSRSSSVTRSRT